MKRIKINEKNKSLKRKFISLKYKILTKKPRMEIAKKKVKKKNLDVLGQASEGVQ